MQTARLGIAVCSLPPFLHPEYLACLRIFQVHHCFVLLFVLADVAIVIQYPHDPHDVLLIVTHSDGINEFSLTSPVVAAS